MSKSISMIARIADTQNAVQVNGSTGMVRLMLDVSFFLSGDVSHLFDLLGDNRLTINIKEGAEDEEE